MKLTTRELGPSFGGREFDMPILERGSRTVDGRTVNYYVQPCAAKANPADLAAFVQRLRGSGWHFNEPFPNQLGRYDGQVFLLDPWAVTETAN